MTAEQSAGRLAGYPVEDLLGYLEGRWTIDRTLEDHGTDQYGRFAGELRCRREDTRSMLLSEHGELDWGGMRRAAFRATRLVIGDEAWAGEMSFADGRRFHRLDLRTGSCAAVHPCAPDTYEGVFDVAGPDDWSYAWHVSGPGKNLRLTSKLRRI